MLEVWKMTEGDAQEAVQAYATAHDVPWVWVVRTGRVRSWWGRTSVFSFEIDTGDHGPATAAVWTRIKAVVRFKFRTNDPRCFWLPPWAAFPLYNSVTIGWRMGDGEQYWLDWTDWFRKLRPDRRAAYRRRFPAPNCDGWEDFYDLCRWNWEPARTLDRAS
jgi:hypothetical protein